MKITLIIIQSFLIFYISLNQKSYAEITNDGVCEAPDYTRKGVPVSVCDQNEEKDGGLCYPNCDSGYYGVGPVCWERCSSGFKDTGASCFKPADTYNKGCCCVSTIFGKKCCNKCKPGYTDFGCTCSSLAITRKKDSYGRGAGHPLWCKSDEEYHAGLCYPKCEKFGYIGKGNCCVPK